MHFRWQRHLLYWLGYFVFDFFQGRSLLSIDTRVESGNWIPAIVALIDPWPKILLFYLLYFMVLRPVMRGTTGFKIYHVVLSVALIALGVMIMRTLNYYFIFSEIYRYQMNTFTFFRLSSLFATLVDVLVPVSVLIVIELIIHNGEVRKTQAQLEKARLQAELQYLRSQVNPHFLFNVLSSIHALTVNTSPDAAHVTLRLSKLMRFMLYGVQRKQIPVDDEIRFIEDFVALQKMRFGNKLDVQFNCSIDNELELIAPLLLLPIVENAFKHGGIEEAENASIIIDLNLQQRILELQVKNKVPEQRRLTASGIGLQNLRRQLELTYPTYRLTLNRVNDVYDARLKLNLAEYADDVVHHN